MFKEIADWLALDGEVGSRRYQKRRCLKIGRVGSSNPRFKSRRRGGCVSSCVETCESFLIRVNHTKIVEMG